MRPIKFRAWDKVEKRMIFEPTLIGSTQAFIIGGEIIADGIEFTFNNEGQRDCVLMQYTGLKDKNGKEIYEGDIVINTNNQVKTPATIKWYRGGFMQQLKGYFGYRNIETFDGDSRYMEIIGNIYENKDLLK